MRCLAADREDAAARQPGNPALIHGLLRPCMVLGAYLGGDARAGKTDPRGGTSLLRCALSGYIEPAFATAGLPDRQGRHPMRIENVFLFDLDGTLVDSVYQHVLAWREALDEEGIELSVWRIHRKIGMSGGLFTDQLLRETGLPISPDRVDRLRRRHAAAYQRAAPSVRPLPGARELLATLTEANVPWAIATSGRMETAAPNLAALGVDPARVPVVTRDQVKYAKPDPDLFLAAAERLDAPIESAVVVGDSIWDMLAARRCRALGVGVLSGGYGQDELERSGALRVYEDPRDLLKHIDEVGGRR
jgi:HAD superfamily hydrolase (TIGR01509 family)